MPDEMNDGMDERSRSRSSRARTQKKLRSLSRSQRSKRYGRFKNQGAYRKWYRKFAKAVNRKRRWGFGAMPKGKRRRIARLANRAKKGQYRSRNPKTMYNAANRAGLVGPRKRVKSQVKRSIRWRKR